MFHFNLSDFALEILFVATILELSLKIIWFKLSLVQKEDPKLTLKEKTVFHHSPVCFGWGKKKTLVVSKAKFISNPFI